MTQDEPPLTFVLCPTCGGMMPPGPAECRECRRVRIIVTQVVDNHPAIRYIASR